MVIHELYYGAFKSQRVEQTVARALRSSREWEPDDYRLRAVDSVRQAWSCARWLTQ